MSQNQLITILSVVLLVVILASALVLLRSTPVTEPSAPVTTEEGADEATNHFQIDILQRQAYQLLNKQLVKEGALPVQPATATGKANPFL